MNDGDPVAEEAKPEVVEQVDETVLSQDDTKEPVLEKQEEEAKPSGKTPEERFKNSQFAQTRLVRKEYKKELEKLRSDPRAILEEAAKEAGYDLSKEENKSHIDLQVNVEKKRSDAERAIRHKASNLTIKETLTSLGVDPSSKKGFLIGNSLWSKYGPDDPDVFQNEDLVRKEIESIEEEFVGKKNQVNDVVMRKAGASLPQKVSPRGTQTPSEDKRIESESKEMGVSKEKFKIISEKTKKLPSWAKRRS